MQCNNISSQIRRDDLTQSDVVSAEVYKTLKQRRHISPEDITLQWNTDGVKIFKSSKVQLWSIQVMINKLPFNLRRENVILCGLWYDPKKPLINTFLKPFIDKLIEFHKIGFEYMVPGQSIPVRIKVHALIASVDSQARPLLQRITQYNGVSGYSFCLHTGRIVSMGHGTTRVYERDVQLLRDA